MPSHDTRRIRELADYLDDQVWSEDLHGKVRRQALEEGCNSDGFDGVLSPLRKVLDDWLSNRTDELFRLAAERLQGTTDELRAVADHYDAADDDNLTRLRSLEDEVEEAGR